MADDADDEEENTATKVARTVNKVNRTLGREPNKGAISVQQTADMQAAEKISDAVPRKDEAGASAQGKRRKLYDNPRSRALQEKD